MTYPSYSQPKPEPQALPLGSYRHDVAYTAALKSTQALPLGNYRNDVAYTAALKSVQALPLGNYRNDVAYTAALKSGQALPLGNYRHDVAYTAALKSGQFSGTAPQGVSSFELYDFDSRQTDVEHGLASVIFWADSFGTSPEGLGAGGVIVC
jgi:hypothetical protein